MTKDLNAKLRDVEAKMRRWQGRLTRAHNTVAKLNRQRLRLQGQLANPRPIKLITEIKDYKPDDIAVPQPVAFVEPDPKLDIPPFLQRKEVDVDTLKAQRKSKELPDKTKMPLTGRAALDAIRPKRKSKATG